MSESLLLVLCGAIGLSLITAFRRWREPVPALVVQPVRVAAASSRPPPIAGSPPVHDRTMS
jgi:hypothetical protein